MAKHSSSGKKNKGMVKLSIVIKKLQKSFLLVKRLNSYYNEYDEAGDSTYVPEDVKEGHFAVIAMDNEEHRRFVVPLSYLAHPTFVSLLEQAAEEYGFDREGALTIPCRPSELERILAEE